MLPRLVLELLDVLVSYGHWSLVSASGRVLTGWPLLIDG